MDYKEKDRKNIINYILGQGGVCSVEDIITNSGAEKLRVYPILFEEQQFGHVQFVKETLFGAPEIIKLI